MKVVSIALSLFFLSEVAAQFGLFDYGGLDFFMAPGYNEGPCIERKRRRRRRRRRRRKSTQAPPSNTIVETPVQPVQNPVINIPAAPVAAAPVQDPLFGPFDFMLDIFNPAPLNPPIPSPQQSPNPAPFRSQGLTIDYSKLTNQELRSLLEIAARQAGVKMSDLTRRTKAQGTNPNSVPTYADLVKQLADLQLLAQEQRDTVANNARNLSPAAKNFRSLGKMRRAAERKVSKRQANPFDFFGFGAGSTDYHMSFCSCYEKSELDPDYIVQSRRKWKCKTGLVCACNPGRFTKK